MEVLHFSNALLRELKLKKIASRQIPNARIALPVLAAGLFVGMATGHAQAPSQQTIDRSNAAQKVAAS
jgi:hypothetical protein